MRESILQRIRNFHEHKPRSLIARTHLSDSESKIRLLTGHVQSSVKHLTQGLATASERAKPTVGDSHTVSELVRAKLDLHLESLLTGGAVPTRFFDLVINAGSAIHSPPYDAEWNIGSGFAFGARTDGKFLTIQPKAGETSGAGVGVILQSSTQRDASIIPQGTYSASIFSVENQPPGCWSAGGLGLTIYKGANQVPEISRIVTLWSMTNIVEFSGRNLEGTIADATSLSPPGLWFPNRLVDFTLSMEPDTPYLVWVWSWQTDNLPEHSGFLALMSVNMPAISVSAGPAVIVK